jgi:hypothetical protein
MSPIRDSLIGRNALVKRLCAGLAAALLFSLVTVAKADTTTNFTGDFQAAFWAAQPQAGAIFFTNADTELVVAGPNKPASETTSIDPITYNGPAAAGLVTDGTVAFDWQYDSPSGLDDSAYFTWTPPGGTPINILLAQGGGISTGNSFSIDLQQGSTFSFVLFSDTPANKVGASLIITNFTFSPSVPEPSTAALLGGGLLLFVAARRRGQSA